ncbi:hypothetical protein PFISCL1PPCAC_20090, partial [Pristionchus fissidentatus]
SLITIFCLGFSPISSSYHSRTRCQRLSMRSLLFLLSIFSLVFSNEHWEGSILRAASTDCSACKLAEAGLSQQIPDSTFSGLSSKCSLLPSQLGFVCEQGLSTIINYIKDGLKSRIPNCKPLCASPSPITTAHFCSIIHPAYISLDSLFADLSSTLIPAICLTQSDHHGCVQKIGGIITIAKTPINNVFKRVGILLKCKEFESAGDPGKIGADWTPLNILCTGCQSTLKGLSLTISGEDTQHLSDALQNTLESACESIRMKDATLLHGAPTCPDAASLILHKLKEDDRANDRLCQIAYGCPPMRTKEKEEL